MALLYLDLVENRDLIICEERLSRSENQFSVAKGIQGIKTYDYVFYGKNDLTE